MCAMCNLSWEKYQLNLWPTAVPALVITPPTYLLLRAAVWDTCLSRGAATGSTPTHKREVVRSGKSVWLENAVCVAESTGGTLSKSKQPNINGLENTIRTKAETSMVLPALEICQASKSKTHSNDIRTQAIPSSELILPGPLCYTVQNPGTAQLNIPCSSRPKEKGAWSRN